METEGLDDDKSIVAPETVADTLSASIKTEIVRETVKNALRDSKVRFPDEAASLLTDLINSMVVEATLRGTKQALRDHSTKVEIEHIEKILPQLMLDFP